MQPSRRHLSLLFACGALPVMTTASLAPVLPGLHAAFINDPNIDMLSRFVLATPSLAIALGASFIGYLLDHWGRKQVLTLSLLSFALFGSFGLWVSDIRLLILSRFLLGFGVAGILTATPTLLADHYQTFQLRRIVGLQAAVAGIWGIVSQTGSGWLAERDWRQPFALYLIALPLLLLVWLCLGGQHKGPMVANSKLHKGSKISRQTWMLGLYSMLAMSLFAIVPSQTPFYFSQLLSMRPSSIAFLVSALTGASSLTSLAVAVWPHRSSPKVVLCIGFLLLALGLSTLALWPHPWILVLGMMTIGCGIGLIIPCINVWTTELVAPHQRGRAMGLLATANSLGQFLTPMWSQGLLEIYGFEGLFLSAAIIALFLLLFLSFKLPRAHLGKSEEVLEISVYSLEKSAAKARKTSRLK